MVYGRGIHKTGLQNNIRETNVTWYKWRFQIVNIDGINTVKSNNGYSAQWRLTLTEQVLPTF